ncbi:MAG: hypothetical protein AB8E82_13330 [Aureispira sp.]
MKQLLLLFTSCCLTLSLSAQQQIFTKAQVKEIKKFIKNAAGVYNNKAQADTTKNPLLRLSEIRTFRIWTHKKKEYWVSIGWYQPGVPEQPMGEKIFHIKSFEDGKFILDCYSWKDPTNEALLLQWLKRHPYKQQTKDALVHDGCTNYLIKTEQGNYELKTLEGDICNFNNPVAPFDGLFFHFIFGKNGKKMNIHDINYKDKKVIFHYIDAPMRMIKLK